MQIKIKFRPLGMYSVEHEVIVSQDAVNFGWLTPQMARTIGEALIHASAACEAEAGAQATVDALMATLPAPGVEQENVAG